jgi:hypothetical protein
MTQSAPSLTNYGYDLSCESDLDRNFGTVSGRLLLSQALVRRIITPRGMLFYDPNYGYDITSEVSDDLLPADLGRIGQEMDAEFLKDQRVISSITQVTTVTAPDGTLSLSTLTTITDGNGPFPLTLAISQVTVTLLQSQYSGGT